MIRVVFMIGTVEKKIEIEFPAVPRIGDQIYLNDFLSENAQKNLLDAGVNADSLKVINVVWMKEEKVYVTIFLD